MPKLIRETLQYIRVNARNILHFKFSQYHYLYLARVCPSICHSVTLLIRYSLWSSWSFRITRFLCCNWALNTVGPKLFPLFHHPVQCIVLYMHSGKALVKTHPPFRCESHAAIHIDNFNKHCTTVFFICL